MATIHIRSPLVIAQILRAPLGLGLTRAYLSGTLDITGDLTAVVARERTLAQPSTIRAVAGPLLCAAHDVRLADIAHAGPLGVERVRHGRARHSARSDSADIAFHYDRSVAFYRFLLGASMTYSCAWFEHPGSSLEDAQDAKHQRILNMLEVRNRTRFLDIGCGWGSLLRQAVARGADASGFTAARQQYEYCNRQSELRGRVVAADYRHALPAKPEFDACASVGVYEHVGLRNSETFFGLVRRSLRLGGLYIDQAIYRPEEGRKAFRRNGFVERYIFPNGQLQTLATRIKHMDHQGLHVLRVESTGDHYSQTIGHWIDNLSRHWRQCVDLEGEARVRAWMLYLMGSKHRFENRDIDVARVLAVAV